MQLLERSVFSQDSFIGCTNLRHVEGAEAGVQRHNVLTLIIIHMRRVPRGVPPDHLLDRWQLCRYERDASRGQQCR